MTASISIARLNSDQKDFDQALSKLLAWNDETDQQVTETVQNILNDVRRDGDQALIETTNKFDRRSVSKMSELELSSDQMDMARQNLDPKICQALEVAAERVKDYHQHQLQESWSYTEKEWHGSRPASDGHGTRWRLCPWR